MHACMCAVQWTSLLSLSVSLSGKWGSKTLNGKVDPFSANSSAACFVSVKKRWSPMIHCMTMTHATCISVHQKPTKLIKEILHIRTQYYWFIISILLQAGLLRETMTVNMPWCISSKKFTTTHTSISLLKVYVRRRAVKHFRDRIFLFNKEILNSRKHEASWKLVPTRPPVPVSGGKKHILWMG